jgi:hypothetical protein
MLFDFGIRAAFECFGWCIYLKGYRHRLDAHQGAFDFTRALHAYRKARRENEAA